MNKEQILKDAVDNFGIASQLDMAIEECAELIQAINKIKRTFKSEDLIEIKKRMNSQSFDGQEKGKGFDSVSDALIYGNVCSEIADVKIMMLQLENIFSVDHIFISEQRKIARLQKRIERFKAGDVNVHKSNGVDKIFNEPNLETMARMPDCFLDLTITSPPYNLGNDHHIQTTKGRKTFTPYEDDLPEPVYQEQQIEMLGELYRVTKEGGSLMYNHKNRIKNGKQITPYEWLLKTNWTIKQELVWFNRSQNFDKCRFYPMTERIYWLSKTIDTGFTNLIGQHDLLKDTAEGTDKEHKRAFPVKLARRFIICFPDAKLIYDPYSGSGTTAIAAMREKRNFIGSESLKNYYEQSKKRIEHEKDNPMLDLF